MKIINTTDYPDAFLRRLVSWCCREIGLPVRRLRLARFGNSRSRWSGHAVWRSRIGVRIGSAETCDRELKHWKFRDGFQVVTYSRLEVLVVTTAHELSHIEQFWRVGDNPKGLERRTEGMAWSVLNAFRSARDTLVSEWSAEPANPVRTVLSVQERRQRDTLEKLATWERKLKLARTKVAKYKAKSRYYEKAIAAKKGT